MAAPEKENSKQKKQWTFCCKKKNETKTGAASIPPALV
jgi:hypothetical protein